MKISSNQYYEVLTKQLAKQQESIGELQTQLATGKKTAVPSSDIESSLEGLSIKSVLQRQSAYETNLSYVKDRLTRRIGCYEFPGLRLPSERFGNYCILRNFL